MADKKVNIVIAAKNRVGRVIGSIQRRLKGLARSAISVQGAIAGAVGGAIGIAGVTRAIRAADQQITAERKLAAVLKATGGAAGFSAAQFKKRAAELQQATVFGDEAILGLQAQLASMREINGQEFDRATKAALDLSTVFDQSLKQSARQVGVALADPARGMTRLNRVGVTFTETEKQLVQQLQETGRMAEAQALILDKLEGAFDGVSEAVAEGPIGAIKQAQNAIGDMVEAIGKKVAPLVAAVAGFATDLAEKHLPKVLQAIRFATVFVFNALEATASAITEARVVVAKSLAAMGFGFENWQEIAGLAVDRVLLAIEQMRSRIVWVFTDAIPGVLVWLRDNWRNILRDLGESARVQLTNLADNLVRIFKNLPGLIRGSVDFSDLWTPLTEGFKATLEELPDIGARSVSDMEKELIRRVEGMKKNLGGGLGERLDIVEANVRADADRGALASLRELAGKGLEATLATAGRAGAEAAVAAAAGAGTGTSSASTTGGVSARGSGRASIDALDISRQFRGLSDRFRANSMNVKGPEARTAENTQRAAEQAKRQTKALEMLARGLRDGSIRTVRGTLTG